MRCEVIAIGTELLLGQIVDTNSSWIGEQLALAGIDCLHQSKVGDNLGRMVESLRVALGRADAVIVCGGLGPTQDDITREAIAEVMGVDLVRDDAIAQRIRDRFAARGRHMTENNLRQADVPRGASPIPQMPGTAPGLVCPVGERVVYAVPGVPWEMRQMMEGTIVPDLRRRAGDTGIIRSRVVRTWGLAESALAEILADRITALDATGNPTIAFLASGIEGLKVRLTAKAPDAATAARILAEEEARVCALLGEAVFGFDDQTMESVVLDGLVARGLTVAVAESVTGGMVASRLAGIPGASRALRGGVVAYSSEVKRALLGVPEGPVVTADCAKAMADGVRRLLGADVGLATTGVAGPDEQEGQPVGTVWLGVAVGDEVSAEHQRLPGDRERIRQYAVISLLSALRRVLGIEPAG
ncbi:MAG: competence/damage-inducible protein A [Ectothiorhodospiraceae bacterium]|nr:competence/damage-inducible protein A [Chromatiales bacterium]MCP5156010.1 competence/damage-inducible protein A [Ectothiorhodospiraceae bacterium]